jgi:D-glycero-D-manno-heptose 1,7-bisphosphate phosphatase
MTRRAVFLDRDGVIVADDGEIDASPRLQLLPGAAEAIAAIRGAGWRVFVVTNQPVVARGLATEADVRAAHSRLAARLADKGATIDAFYFCPHHPNATVSEYRVACACRKPRPGMLESAAKEWEIDLASSVMIGDRPSDMAAGKRAGCRAILVESGMHGAPAIESPDPFDDARPDAIATDLAAAIRGLIASSRPGAGW